MRLDVYSDKVSFKKEDDNKKNSLNVYTAHMLAAPEYVPVRHISLDLDNGLPGVVLRIVKKTMMILSDSWLTSIPAPPWTRANFYCINLL